MSDYKGWTRRARRLAGAGCQVDAKPRRVRTDKLILNASSSRMPRWLPVQVCLTAPIRRGLPEPFNSNRLPPPELEHLGGDHTVLRKAHFGASVVCLILGVRVARRLCLGKTRVLPEQRRTNGIGEMGRQLPIHQDQLGKKAGPVVLHQTGSQHFQLGQNSLVHLAVSVIGKAAKPRHQVFFLPETGAGTFNQSPQGVQKLVF